MTKKRPITTVCANCWACACYFVLRGKYAGCYNSNFQRNFVGLFWPVFAAATGASCIR